MATASTSAQSPKHALHKFVVRYGAGQTIFGEGDNGATMYIVQSGKVRLYRTLDGGKERDLGMLEKGDFFGEMSILEGLPRNSSAQAVEAADLIEINSTTFDKMIRSNIEIAIRLLRKLSIRLREAERRLEEVHSSGGPSMSMSSSAGAAPPQHEGLVSGVRLEIEEAGLVFPLRENETLVGRYDPVTELKPDVDLTEADLKRSVSRRHARVIKTGNNFSIIEEVGALNGTFVNSKKLVTGQAHPIADGDEIGVGMVKLLFRT